MTVQWAAELGIPEEVATTLATWEVAVLTRTEKRFVDKLCGAGMDEADATKAWDKLQERRNGTCAALCFAWRARFWQSHSPDPSCSPLALLSILLRFIRVPLFRDWTRGGHSHAGPSGAPLGSLSGVFFGRVSWSLPFLALMSRQLGSWRPKPPPPRLSALQARPSCRCQRRPPPVRRSAAVVLFFGVSR